jgi:hypothetical protein
MTESRVSTVDWLIETLGPLRAFEAFMALGGCRYYVPKRSDAKWPSGKLSRFFTAMELELLVRRSPGEYIKLPVGREHCIQVLYWHCGDSVPNIARALRMSEDGVFKKLGKDPPAWLNPHTAARRTRGAADTRAHDVKRSINEQLGLSKEDLKLYRRDGR